MWSRPVQTGFPIAGLFQEQKKNMEEDDGHHYANGGEQD
jgi:hypothetical protein